MRVCASVCVYVFVCVLVCVHWIICKIYLHKNIYMYVCVCMCMCVCVCVCVCVYVHARENESVFTHIYIGFRTYNIKHDCVYIYIHTFIY